MILTWMIEECSALLKSEDLHLDDYFMIRSPKGLLTLIGLYALFVLKVGPALMKQRKAINLKKVIMAYNCIQIVSNAIIFALGVKELIRIRPSFLCFELDKASSGLLIVKLVYCYHLLKLLDLLETIFFVLRKKNRQVTFLHVYHHIAMVFASWVACKWVPGGHGSFLGLVNSFIHVIMYIYYFLTSSGLAYRNIWWKKYLTQLQTVQQLFYVLIFSIALVNPKCSYPKIVLLVLVSQCTVMYFLFRNFYVKTYKTEINKNKS